MLFAMPGNESMTAALSGHGGWSVGHIEIRNFPDDETYLRFITDPAGHDVVLVCTLDHPNPKFLPLVFAARTARSLGARHVSLVAPYLAYMRQDKRFHPGEAITSRPFATLLSESFDGIVTVDPHLHRYRALSEIYSVPALVVHAAQAISGWITQNVENPLLIGPDGESEQWVRAVADDAHVPFTIFDKVRMGDRDVTQKLRDPHLASGRTPVLMDDIISSGVTMLGAMDILRPLIPAAPVCIGVHGLFAGDADRKLEATGARVVTTNTIVHRTNAIDMAPLLAASVCQLIGAQP